ncbi:MAG: PRC-barrel domain containing protein [Chitinophagaceae bacterium]|nr:PRC-barrel domain containing protein [Rubrivivax sp.]
MLNRTSQLVGSSVTASDGAIGHVRAAFFDDQAWAIRYIVVDTGDWLRGREVLISPYAVRQPVGSGKNIDVALTRDQVQNSPDVDTHQPVSRAHERTTLAYYGYPDYWEGSALWAMGGYPLVPSDAEMTAHRSQPRVQASAEDSHLRSCVKVTGYDIRATDDSIGHVHDFVFDDESWVIRYLVVDTRNWWPGGRKVLVAKHWIEHIDWDTQTVQVNLTRHEVKNSPEHDEAGLIERADEERLHQAYGRPGYWD